MATKNGNLSKKTPKLRQIHPKSRKFESCHLTRMQPVWISLSLQPLQALFYCKIAAFRISSVIFL